MADHSGSMPYFPRSVYDFHLCVGLEELKQTMEEINGNGYDLISVTQYKDVYTVFFRRFLP